MEYKELEIERTQCQVGDKVLGYVDKHGTYTSQASHEFVVVRIFAEGFEYIDYRGKLFEFRYKTSAPTVTGFRILRAGTDIKSDNLICCGIEMEYVNFAHKCSKCWKVKE